MNFYKIFIIYFFIIFSINAKNICSTQEKIYADKGLAKITLQLPERQKNTHRNQNSYTFALTYWNGFSSSKRNRSFRYIYHNKRRRSL